jgi:NAD+ diphosphatase
LNIEPKSFFTYCPKCGSASLSFDGKNRYNCSECAFIYFQNTAVGCGAILEYEGNILLLQRGREPQKGWYDFPGGFIDPGESLEQGLKREIREELGIEARDLKYLHSAPNYYPYKKIEYFVCDVVFTGKIDQHPEKIQENEIHSFVFVSRAECRKLVGKIAFPSLREACSRFLDDA